jgi:enoyl-CoA hydratase/carnithine racemase
VATPPKGTKVIAITADAPDFCAGYDIIEASRGEPEELIANEKNFAALRHSKVPLIAALHGNVIGGGLELALLADVRVASPETKMAIPASRIGLVYSEAGIRLVVATLGESVARSLFLGGRELTAEAALSLGVVSEVVGRDQLRERTLELAASMASWSEVASSGNRQIIDSITRDASIDIDALRREAFAPHGGLRHYIAQFVARRANAPGGLVH